MTPLPGLPEPDHYSEGGVYTFYTAAQMLELQRQTLEWAAQRCEEVGPKGGPIKLVSDGFAAAIREAIK